MKLEENPKGYHLDGSYSCSICRETTPPGDNWYDKYGIKCLVCQWAIDHKEIPASVAKDEDTWYRKFDFEHYFNVKGPTLGKWIRNGIVKPRTISKYGKGTHTEIFLIKDNKDFCLLRSYLNQSVARWLDKVSPSLECILGIVLVIHTRY